ncbi:MAG: hypothetical protein JRG69_04230 [Deltaproteobacteria bacterium]|nr:hypothetical protein [Deltaproteobacteria bacterium]
MLKIPTGIESSYKAFLEKNGVALKYRHHYLKWLRYYLDFCRKYQFESVSTDSVEPFIQKLTQKGKQINSGNRPARLSGFSFRMKGKNNSGSSGKNQF